MGANQSSPSSSSTQHVFSSDTPVQFSQELIDSLQASSETNSTRAKTLDLHIQQRVAAELEKIQSKESKRLLDIQTELTSSSSKSNSETDNTKSKIKQSIPGLKGSSEEQKRKEQSSAQVQKEIEALRKKLGERKILKDLPKELETARENVVGCLRVNDRRPLDCWKEVEAFKREVRRLEEKFVGDVL